MSLEQKSTFHNHDEETFALIARSVIKQYKNTDAAALNRFNLMVKTGEFYGLLGPNGAGKTTAISIFCGISSVDQGSVEIMGMKLPSRLNKVKQVIGLAPQNIALYNNLSAHENLVFLGKLQGIRSQKLQERIEECLEFVQLIDHCQKRVSTYSGGMKRRLNLGAALLNKPRVLFLDEPTVGIDIQSRHLIYENLIELNQNGTTIFYTTHYLREAQELCSRIGIIDYGCLVKEGHTKQLMQECHSDNLDELLLNLSGKQLRDN